MLQNAAHNWNTLWTTAAKAAKVKIYLDFIFASNKKKSAQKYTN